MSDQRRQFVVAFMGKANGNATKAAEMAHYSKKTAAQQATRLLKDVQVRAAIKARQVKVEQSDIADRAERQRFWTSTQRDAKQTMQNRLRASELQAKTNGEFLEAERPVVLVNVTQEVVSKIPTADLEKALAAADVVLGVLSGKPTP